MRKLTAEELREPDVELIILPGKWGHWSKEIDDLLYGYIGRELHNGSVRYVIPGYLAREIELIGRRLKERAA